MNKLSQVCNFCNNTSQHCCPESDKNYEAEQAKREREFKEKVFADCDKWDNRELGADEAYAKNADLRWGPMVVRGKR